jgi:acetoin utilization deacetylase AcuC-like enzyme
MLPFKLVYHKGYDLNLGEHVFPSQKFRLITETLLEEGIGAPADFLTPRPASDEDILRVHTPEWVDKLKTGTLTASEIMKLEIPYSREAVEACWLAAGGSIFARWVRMQFGRRVSSCLPGAWRRILCDS